MLTWSIEELVLPLAYNWKISRNESVVKTNYIVTVTDGIHTGKGEVAPNIRYGETPELIKEQFHSYLQELYSIDSLGLLVQYIENKQIVQSLQFGIESSYVHYLASVQGVPVYTFLGLEKPGIIETSYTLPIMDVVKVESFINQYNLHRFKYLKIKINQESGLDFIAEVAKVSAVPLRIDANESWQDVDKLLVFMEKCKRFSIQFFEQPLPSTLITEYHYLKKHSPFELIADESITNNVDMENLSRQFHGVNMKLMKAGGYLNGLKILNSAKQKGLKTMIGCMVETSLGIFSAINLCNHINYIDLDGHFLIENEPFKIVSEKDGKLFI